jgi:hypothetical protein
MDLSCNLQCDSIFWAWQCGSICQRSVEEANQFVVCELSWIYHVVWEINGNHWTNNSAIIVATFENWLKWRCNRNSLQCSRTTISISGTSSIRQKDEIQWSTINRTSVISTMDCACSSRISCKCQCRRRLQNMSSIKYTTCWCTSLLTLHIKCNIISWSIHWIIK